MNNAFKHMSLYILILSIADLCVLFVTPAVMMYFLNGSWNFGYIGCKVFFAVENVNKLLSVAILTLMSVERFFVICRPFKSFCCRRKRVSNVLLIVFGLLIAIIVFCMPIISYAKTSEIVTVRDGTQQTIAVLCVSALPDHIMSIFITYMFILGFVLPCIIISKNRRTTPFRYKSHKTSCEIGFDCGFPFWLFVILPLLSYLEFIQFEFLENEIFQNIRMFSSFLPYLNSACNWIFYTKALRHTPLVNQPRRFQPDRGPKFLPTNQTANTRV
ncbi:putative G-protein coupled receptor C06G4.5 [Aphelenchoides bicaudatus]|nr:putative G-protein coupled receptor C06G4.5 [Aphelenchoides bicaudatus]